MYVSEGTSSSDDNEASGEVEEEEEELDAPREKMVVAGIKCDTVRFLGSDARSEA